MLPLQLRTWCSLSHIELYLLLCLLLTAVLQVGDVLCAFTGKDGVRRTVHADGSVEFRCVFGLHHKCGVCFGMRPQVWCVFWDASSTSHTAHRLMQALGRSNGLYRHLSNFEEGQGWQQWLYFPGLFPDLTARPWFILLDASTQQAELCDLHPERAVCCAITCNMMWRSAEQSS